MHNTLNINDYTIATTRRIHCYVGNDQRRIFLPLEKRRPCAKRLRETELVQHFIYMLARANLCLWLAASFGNSPGRRTVIVYSVK